MSERPPVGPPRGLLPGAAPPPEGEHRRVAPPPALAPYVAHFWWVSWDLSSPRVVETLPHPTVHVVFEAPDHRATLTPVSLRRFTRTLEGRGRVFGVKLRPAVFGALSRVQVASLRERSVGVGEVLAAPLVDALRALGDDLRAITVAEDAVRAAEARLVGLSWPVLPSALTDVRDLVERLEHGREIVRVEDAARMASLDARTLERRFRAWVGLTPKSVLARYRLIEAAERVQHEADTPLVAVAAAVGYSDQAHFSREFRAVVGRTPRQLRDDARALHAAGSGEEGATRGSVSSRRPRRS